MRVPGYRLGKHGLRSMSIARMAEFGSMTGANPCPEKRSGVAAPGSGPLRPFWPWPAWVVEQLDDFEGWSLT